MLSIKEYLSKEKLLIFGQKCFNLGALSLCSLLPLSILLLLISLIISLVFLGCSNAEQLNVFGYEFENGNKVDITTGDQASLDVIVKYFEGYNNKDLETVESLEHEDFLGFAHTGQVVEGSKQHIEMSKQFLDQFPNAKWEILWSISSDINFRDKPSENWVTTCLNTSYGEGDNANNFQRIFDAQIINGKIR